MRVALDRDDVYALSVSDQGPGIAAEAQSRIFERFYRVDTARTHDGVSDGGAGLGLALARWIAHVHGGDIKLAARRGLDQPSSSRCLSAPKPAPQSYFTEGVVSSISAFPLLFVVNVPTCFASMKTV